MSLASPDNAPRRAVAAQDVFFSTTDSKGVITHANATFLRLAALTESDAVGSPHNLIRHPDMPGGLFAAMWEELEAGRPVCAYMANQAADGARYDVLATITPVDGGYLSVRLRPGVPDLQTRVYEVYDDVAAAESSLRSAGGSRHEVARQGGELLAERLSAADLGSFADLTRRALPLEIEALLRDLPPLPDASRSGALGVVVQAAQRTVALTEPFVAHLEGFETLAQRVAAERASVAPAVEQLQGLESDLVAVVEALRARGAVPGEASEQIEASDAVALAALTEQMIGWTREAIGGLETVPVRLGALRDALRALALRISMLVLLAHMVARFTAEVVAAAEARGTELRLLAAALHQGLDAVELEVAAVTSQLREIPQVVEQAVRATDKVTLRMDGWHAKAEAVGELADATDLADPADLSDLCAAVRARLADKLRSLNPIVGLSTRLRQTPVRFDTQAVRSELDLIAAGVESLA